MGIQLVFENITCLSGLLVPIHRALKEYSASFSERYKDVQLAVSYTLITE